MTPARANVPSPLPARLHGWGGGTAASALLARPQDEAGVRGALGLRKSAACSMAIARGMGRSYGDAAQLSGGLVIDTTALKGFQLDQLHGTVRTQAGVTLGELLGAVVPAGWVLPVLPGTQHVTIGGAIASDIHGKNHAADGTFSKHVLVLGLLTATGEVLELEPGSDEGLFEATAGGMGLTGVILWAQIALRPISSSFLSVDLDRASVLDDALDLLSSPGGRHRVAWLDLLGSSVGRGIVTRAEHVERDADAPSIVSAATVQARATVPRRWPAMVLRPSTVRTFNELRYRRSPRSERGRLEALGTHMFPLDVLNAWPRLYGRRGLLQYQLVVPSGQERVLEITIERVRRARVPCYLAVLKDFGPANGAPLSFPIEGWTLALDLPRAAPGVPTLLDGLDELVAEAGGRVYLSKDARIRPDAVRWMYPGLEQWQAVRDRIDPDRVWGSDLALRTGLLRR
jgi:decaprenylphospho-beta-D-ribofuranose 2-oxidase